MLRDRATHAYYFEVALPQPDATRGLRRSVRRDGFALSLPPLRVLPSMLGVPKRGFLGARACSNPDGRGVDARATVTERA
jgi:hypothetical protein